VALYFCPYFHQLLINFQNSFTGTLCKKFAITLLLHIPPDHKCISTLLCEILMKYAYALSAIASFLSHIGRGMTVDGIVTTIKFTLKILDLLKSDYFLDWTFI